MSKLTEEMRDLYQEMILDHHKNPRNFVVLDRAKKGEGFNPLCGDSITLYVELDGEIIKNIGFQGSGCAISRASASIMTTLVKGMNIVEVMKLFDKFHSMVTRTQGESINLEEMGKLAVFSEISEYPSRVKCAMLAWHTLKSVLEGRDESVTTE